LVKPICIRPPDDWWFLSTAKNTFTISIHEIHQPFEVDLEPFRRVVVSARRMAKEPFIGLTVPTRTVRLEKSVTIREFVEVIVDICEKA
jgi:hypothetical protein